MDDSHRNIIQSNYASLVEQTDLDLMVSALYEKGVFSEHMIERYKDTRNDVRTRKRQLYVDVMTRGPHAFGHLIEALTEAGYWDLARDLDPNSYLHTNSISNRRPPARNDDFISIRAAKLEKQNLPKPAADPPKTDESKRYQKPVDSDNNPLPVDPMAEIPQFNIQKCTRFVEDDDNGRGIKVYRTRGRPRGVMLVFSYTEFQNHIEDARPGVQVDNLKLKYLFTELGFKVLFYNNLTKDKLVSTLKSLNEVLGGVECLFIVVSSHGYGRAGSSDNDFRCYDGKLMSTYEFFEYFNNINLPALQGVPKVFIFQICRGSKVESWKDMPMPTDAKSQPDVAVFTDVEPARVPGAPPQRLAKRDRSYSDILIAHSTVPGVVSWRHKDYGSWYIQAVCEVFAAHAHTAHVEELFTLVDKHLAEHPEYSIQTSSVDRWGFNCRLYLHPGLYE